MFNTKFILSTLAYAVATTLVAFLWHENIFGAFYREFNIYSNGENPNILLAILGSLLEGAVLSFFVMRYASAGNRVRAGIGFAFLLCLFASSYDVFQTAAIEKVLGAGVGAFLALELSALAAYALIGGSLVGWIQRGSGE